MIGRASRPHEPVRVLARDSLRRGNMTVRSLPLWLGFTLACSESALSPVDTDPPAPTDTAVDTAVDTGELPSPDPVWFSVEGLWVVEDGAPRTGSQLELATWARGPDGAPVQVCSETHAVESAEPTPQPPDDVTLYGLWRVPLASACAGAPDAIELGIGPLLPVLWPATEQVGASVRHTRGLYLAEPGRLLVVGLAATPDQAAGNGAPPSLDPLPDGRYGLRAVWLVPL